MARSAPRAWWAAFCWGVVILCTVPLARPLQDLVSRTIGRQAYLVVVLVILALALLAGGLAIRRALGPVAWRRLPWLLGSGAICGAYTWHLRHAPEEALHFVEYGVLGLLLFRALRCRLSDRSVFPAVLLVGALFGVLDEFVQWLVPGRFWDLRDVFVNALAITLALVALAGAVRPPELSRRPSPRSVRWLCGAAATLLLLVGLSLSNTPPRLVTLVRVLPPLSYLVDHGSVMTEYGQLHAVEGVGRLYSRLSWPELQEQDRRRSVEVARILDGYSDIDDYRVFLRDYPPYGDPFTHELRVHLFRRDRYLERLDDPGLSQAERRRLASTAWAEDRLLRACCAATIAASGYALPAAAWEPHRAFIDAGGDYTSAVSSHLIVSFRPWQAWAVIGLLLAGLLALATRPTSPRRPPAP